MKISLVLLTLLALHSSYALLFSTNENTNEPLIQSEFNNIRVRRSGGLTQSTCHRSAITKRCSLTDDFNECVQSSCSECILQPHLQSTFIGFEMYCPRLTACVCSIIKDASCYAMTSECH